MQARELRPLQVGQILYVSIKLYIKNFKELWKTVVIVVLPVTVLTQLVTLSLLPAGTTVENGRLRFPVGESLFGELNVSGLFAELVGALLISLGTLLAIAAAFKAIADAYLGASPHAGESLRFAGRKLVSLVLVSLLAVLEIGIGFFILIVPGIYFAVAYAVVVPVLLVEDLRGRARRFLEPRALGRSAALVKGRWWPTLATLAVGVLIIPGIIFLPFGASYGEVRFLSVSSIGTFFLVIGVYQAATSIIATPFQAAVITVLYFDLRVRKEGFELELLARSLGLPAASETPPPAFGAPPARAPSPGPPPPPPPPAG